MARETIKCEPELAGSIAEHEMRILADGCQRTVQSVIEQSQNNKNKYFVLDIRNIMSKGPSDEEPAQPELG
ncbi:hypothetical protein ACWICO_08005 [Glutamicibacter sp. NPDC055491]